MRTRREHSRVAMEIFYSADIDGDGILLNEEESGHCIRVLRHRCGDKISVIDGLGTLMRCEITDDSPKGAKARIIETVPDWGSHPYTLDMAVCATKNIDRYEWFVEKACEIGVDRIIPIIGERSERRLLKTDRLRRILLSATKQSLKARIPSINEPLSVKDFILQNGSADPAAGPLRLIAYCFEDETVGKVSIKDALESMASYPSPFARPVPEPSLHVAENQSVTQVGKTSTEGESVSRDGAETNRVIVMIGPEGDFSPEEARLAIEHGFIPVHLGASRLRTETAAVLAASAVYFHFM